MLYNECEDNKDIKRNFFFFLLFIGVENYGVFVDLLLFNVFVIIDCFFFL